jgi:hypothetical protein
MQERIDTTLRGFQPRAWRFTFAGLALIVAAGLVFWVAQTHEKEAPLPYVFYDVKAIDEQGHPVAGAQVTVQNKRAGVTDSFGEWRRFMRTKLGSQVTVAVVKKYQTRSISALRELQIPSAVPQEGEIELALTLQLTDGPLRDASERSDESKTALEKVSTAADAKVPQVNKDNVVGNVSAKAPSPYDNIFFSVLSESREDSTNLDQQAAKFLTDKIMPALQSRAKVLGINVDAKAQWRVTLQHVNGSANDETKGIVVVSANVPGSDSKVEFLKNYQPDPVATARSILWGLKMHGARGYTVFKKQENWYVDAPKGGTSLWSLTDGMVLMGPRGKAYPVSAPVNAGPVEPVRLLVSDSDPCEKNGTKRLSCILYSSHVVVTPPAANWSRLKVQIYGISEGASVFVSGYLAVHEGGKIWSYWGVPNSGANLTIITDGRVAFRRKISSPANQTPVITIPVAKMSQK